MDEKLNKSGKVDTPYERSILEYKPHFEYDPDRKITVTYETEIEFNDEEDGVGGNQSNGGSSGGSNGGSVGGSNGGSSSGGSNNGSSGGIIGGGSSVGSGSGSGGSNGGSENGSGGGSNGGSNGGSGSGSGGSSNNDSNISYTPETRPGEIYDELVDVIEKIEQTIEEVEEIIKDIEIPIPPDVYDKIIESTGDLGDKFEDGIITFPEYEETFNDPDDPVNSIIQDIVTDYAEGTEGSLELEVYEDLRESQSTLEETYYAFKELILDKFFEKELIPWYPIRDVDFLKELDKRVAENIEKGRILREAHAEAEVHYYNKLRNSYGESSFFEAQEEFVATKRPVDIVTREDKHLTESMDLITRMVNGADLCVETIKTGLVWPSNIKDEEVMNLIEQQKDTDDESKEFKNLLTLSLKLQMNQQIQEKKPLRDILKNINNLSRKKRAHNELLTAYQLRDKMYLTMYDSLEYLKSPSKKLGVEAFLNQVAGGMSFIEKEYEGFLNEVYQIYTMDSEVRLEKIEKVLEKEDARVGYRLLKEK